MIQPQILRPIGDSPGGYTPTLTGIDMNAPSPQDSTITEKKQVKTVYEPEPVPQKDYLAHDPATGEPTPSPQDSTDPQSKQVEKTNDFQIAGFNGYLVMLVLAAIVTVYNWR